MKKFLKKAELRTFISDTRVVQSLHLHWVHANQDQITFIASLNQLKQHGLCPDTSSSAPWYTKVSLTRHINTGI